MGAPSTQQSADSGRVRLHITPLNQSLLGRFIPPSLQAQASNISFHAVETHADSGFGYVELPVMEAQKLKKKLNGTTLKGTKVRIEDAKPQKKRKGVVEEQEQEEVPQKKLRRETRRHEDGLLSGHELDNGRYIKRGWTGDLSTKKREKSSKQVQMPVEKRKMQFKAKVPANVATCNPKSKQNQAKDGTKTKKAAADRRSKTVVVQEFSKASKPKPSATKARKADLTYVDGHGWIDEDENLVEAEAPSKRVKMRGPESIPNTAPVVSQNPDTDASASESEVSSVVSDSEEEDEGDVRGSGVIPTSIDTPATAEVGGSADDVEPASTDVHPLEALFKRRPQSSDDKARVPDLAPIDTSFNFFDPHDADPEEDNVKDSFGAPPQTPHTKEDLQWRSIRSAAPTPDTAAIGKRFSISLADDRDDDEDTNELDDTEMKDVPRKTGVGEESQFQKWFYENRGDLNRSWKTRRREEKKLGRQRENKRVNNKLA